MSPASKKTSKKKTLKKKVATKKSTSNATAKASASKKQVTKKKTVTKKPVSRKSKLTGKSVSPEERWHMIAVAAYLRAEKRGFTGGSEIDDWTEAEKEIDALLHK